MSGVLLLDYPEVTMEEVTSPPGHKAEGVTSHYVQVEEKEEKGLHSPYPAWLLSPEGVVIGANLLAAWLWKVPHLNELLGSNVGTIFSTNFRRIPKHKNGEFYTKKTALMKRLISGFGIHPYLPYLKSLRADPELWKIYEAEEWLQHEEWETNREWQYLLRITHPGEKSPNELLEFHVTVSRLKQDAGFFVIGKPHPKHQLTQSLVQHKYTQAMAVADMIKYVQYFDGIKRGVDVTMTKVQSPEIRPEVHGIQEEVKATPEAEIEKYIASHTVWEVLLAWAEEAEKREFKDVEVKGPGAGDYDL